ncbi:hypothetical protein SCP_1402310 [Sparassis crispa]|uniref:DUF6699 domain-containing protein n=1 Tax=Sparassis crispa TaxID=139825 RepID=A0A401H335_9APHY|nr:hypothetical protein SCP_1402310 [Sparassis crispa]GBE88824.1 hypothetical protein SCP_1402310 [Sparassis crispa]
MTKTWKVFGLHVHFATLSDSSTSKPASPYPDDQSSSSDELKPLTTESVVSHSHCTEDAQKQCRAPADPTTTETLSPAPSQPLPLGTFVVPLPTVCGSGVSSAVLPSSSIPEGEQFSAPPDMSAVSPIVVPVLSDPTFRWDISEHPHRVFEKAAFVYEAATEPAASSIIVRIKVESLIWDITVDGSPFVTVEEVLAAVYRCIRAFVTPAEYDKLADNELLFDQTNASCTERHAVDGGRGGVRRIDLLDTRIFDGFAPAADGAWLVKTRGAL